MSSTNHRTGQRTIFRALILTLLCSAAAAQTCTTYKFSNNANFASCIDLPVLNSFLHYTYSNTTNSLSIAFRHTSTSTSTWTAWAINPTSSGMLGSQAFVAVKFRLAHIQICPTLTQKAMWDCTSNCLFPTVAVVQADGKIKAYTSPVTQYTTQLAQGELSFPVGDVSGTYLNGEITIFATLELPDSRTTVNQVWQSGPLSNGNPSQHLTSADHVNSRATLDVLSGQVAVTADPRAPRKKTHGILNVVSWGFMMIIGSIIARYLKVSKSADPAWFYLHASCQSTAYIIGLAGFATGIKLGNESVGIVNTHHRNIGITLVTLATLQVLALFLRPKTDHKHRLKWSIYHRVVGYVVIILSIVNVFKGFVIIGVADRNRRAYVGTLIMLAVVVAVLEVFTWIVVIRRRRKEEAEKVGDGYSGSQHA